MASKDSFNPRSQGVKRILQEAKELEKENHSDFWAAPIEDNLFEWHFVIRVDHAEFKNGLYHGRIILPPQYPLRPPDIMLLTPNGRFELQKRICLSITGYHEDLWQPAWGIRTALTALIAFFATEAKGAVGGLDVPPQERTFLAKKSHAWTCTRCKKSNSELLSINLNSSTQNTSDQQQTKDKEQEQEQETQLEQSKSSDLESQHETTTTTTTSTTMQPNSSLPTPNIGQGTSINTRDYNLVLIDICIALVASAILYISFRKILW